MCQNNTKICRFCGTSESQRWYFKDICRSCRRRQLRETPKVLKEREIKKKLKTDPKCWDCGVDSSNRWYKDNTQCSSCFNIEYKTKNKKHIQEYMINYRQENKEKINERKRQYRKETGKHRFLQSKRKALKKQAIPTWADLSKIEKVYSNCPQNMTVDHIIPLDNELVCGLHIERNLQYLTLSENSFKHNKFDGTSENNSWRNKCR